MNDDTATPIEDLVDAARAGDSGSWDELIRRHQPIINSVTRRCRLNTEDAADVSQTVWLQLTAHLDRLRDARALPGWIKATAEHAAYRTLRIRRRTTSLEPIVAFGEGSLSDSELGLSSTVDDVDSDLLRAEARSAVRDGLATLTPAQRDLLLLLVADPPVPYQQISQQLGLPMGSIGPTRARCLRKLEKTSAVQALLRTGDLAPAA